MSQNVTYRVNGIQNTTTENVVSKTITFTATTQVVSIDAEVSSRAEQVHDIEASVTQVLPNG